MRKFITMAVGVLTVFVLGACGSTPRSTTPKAVPAAVTAPAPVTTAPAPAVTAPPVTAPATTTVPAPVETAGQTAAAQSAASYLSDGQGFSQASLFQQLTSSAGEGFSPADALYGIAAQGSIDWNAQALISAKSYVSMGGFSRADLIQQLTSSAGEGYTLAQATYAVNAVGL